MADNPQGAETQRPQLIRPKPVRPWENTTSQQPQNGGGGGAGAGAGAGAGQASPNDPTAGLTEKFDNLSVSNK